MELYDVVLFAHIAVLLFAFTLTGAIHVSQWLTVRASTVQEMRVLAKPQRWGFLFAPVVALMLGLGGWLVKLSHDRTEEFSVSNGWAWTASVETQCATDCTAIADGRDPIMLPTVGSTTKLFPTSTSSPAQSVPWMVVLFWKATSPEQIMFA